MQSIKRLDTSGDGAQLILVENLEVPTPGSNEILVKVKACGFSFVDEKIVLEFLKCDIVGRDVTGIVTKVGSGVFSLQNGDEIIGILPLDSAFSGCGEFCLFNEYDVVKKPEKLSFEDAAAGIGDIVRAYTALHYHAKVCAGDTLLVIDGATPSGSMAVQLGQLWGAKVLATYSSTAERQYLESLHPPVAQLIEMSHRSNILVSSVMEETGSVGVDCFIDNGVRMFTSEEDRALLGENYSFPCPHKNDVISCLGFAGKWITCQPNLQLDPPDSMQLFLRGASVCFLFPSAWTLMSAQHGRYQHILQDAVNKLEDGTIKCKISKTVTLEEVLETFTTLENTRVGKVVLRL